MRPLSARCCWHILCSGGVWNCLSLSLLCVLLPGLCESSHLGREFITAFMQNSGKGKDPDFQLLITGYSATTLVTVTVHNSTFRRKITVEQGQTVTVHLPPSVEMVGSGTFNSTVLVCADKDITVLSLSYKQYTSETTVVFPVESMGRLYYAVTPSGKADDPYKEFAVMAWHFPTTVSVQLKGAVTFRGVKYAAGSRLTVFLLAFEAAQFQSREDLSGSRIVSWKSVAVLSGHSCTSKHSSCDHVVEQLLPVSSWGTTFIIPPLSFQPKYDLVYIVASQRSHLSYHWGREISRKDMVAGEVVTLETTRSKPLYITSSAGIQVVFFCTGRSKEGFTYDPFIINIPPITSYCRSYHLDGIKGFQNYALIIAKSSEADGITTSGQLLSNVQWKPIQGTDFSWAEYDLGEGVGSHSLESPNSAFGVLSVGISTEFAGYGSQALCRCANSPVCPHSCSTIECRKKERCEITNCSPACVAESEATCQVQGESQYHTFDGQAFSFAGTCTYAIARTCGLDPALPSFSVEAKNQNPRNTRVSSVAFVTVRVYNVTISMDRYAKGLVQVNAQSSSLPVSLMEGKLRVYQRGGSVVVETDFSLRVSYDWSSLVVKISSSFWERVCGLCGNYNGDPGDDFATPAGALAASPVEFGRSWKVEDGDRFCWDDCHGECKSCSPEVVSRYKAEPICGWITKEAGGPFSQCHSVVDPKIYLDNCVYDLCMNDGLQDMLCQALASYADACRGEGVDVSDWRTPAGCPLPCPENSQYQLCGSACPATCNDPAAPHNCSSPCVETCQCNEGFVLDAGKCIRKAGCGCEFQGHLYAPGEPFWGDSACTRRCVCDPQSRQASCEAAGCRAGEQCRVKKGFPNCYPTSYASCTASGDPHYTSFDGHRFDFQGSCQYQLAGQCQEQEELVDFQVLVQNDNRGLRAVSFTRAVEVRVYGVNITVSRDYPGRVLVNGVLINLPYSTDDSKISMYRRGQDAAIQTDFHLTIAFDWQGRVTLTAPSTYAGALCGLCGNFNGDKGDELIMKDGNVAPNATAFGQSWRVAETPGCAEPEKQECSNLAAVNRHQRKIQGECGMILATAGPFRECQRKVPPEGYFQDCIYDYCFFRGHQAVVCQIVASYAAACQAAGVAIEPWRSNSFCDPTCPRNSHYELCGSGCPATCHGLSAPDGCDAPCAEGCFCDAGFLLSGDRCVPVAQCGCVHQGRYYRKGEEFYASASCRERCRCQDNGVVECQEASCGASEECRVESGVLGCYPAGRCTVAGDSHYLSFDGRAFDLHGNCTYTLARVCSSDAGLVNFSVVVGKENAAGGRVARMRAVVVSVHGYTITMERGRKWKVMVGGELYNLPLAMDEGKLLINQEGNNIIVQSASGLQVLYDAASYLLVSVPSTYKGHVCGLCGNFNGDKNDDFLLPSGTSAQDAEEFGASWKVPVDGATCSEGCNDRCPICGANQTAPYRTERSCGLIRATSGPFRDCHSLVNPAEYFNHCLYDMCATNGTGETLCQSLQGYTAACQTAGAKIRAWRTASFCPLPCPANSHYELCTRSCDFTCAGLSSSPQCTERCFEGCQCDNRLLFDGESCVFPGGCGCFQYGRYIKSMETVISANCTENCTCYLRSNLVCQKIACEPRQICMLKNGTHTPSCDTVQCREKETCQMVNGSPVCVAQSSATCWLSGDPHYKTFDGRYYDFMGTCTYTVAKTCGPSVTLPSFTVEAKNENRGNTRVSYAGFLTVRVYNVTISVVRRETGFVRVNAQRSHLPISLLEGKLRVYQRGVSVVIETDFSLRVSYDWNSYLVVQLSSSFWERVCGLCGNYNGDSGDDFATPAGALAASPVEFGKSWKVEDGDRFCWDDCHGECKSCSPELVGRYKVEPFCGWITKGAGGPFSQCHSVVDPKIYLDNCVYDLCMNDGLQDMLCQALASYADACRGEGVDVSDWRTPAGCPLPCPENSQYQLCGAVCPATCNDPAAPRNCSSLCVETCQCNEGFVLDAGKCIPKAGCGCEFQGHLYGPGEPFWGDGACTRRCVCSPQSRQASCEAAGCRAGEQCRVENGIQNCYPSRYGTCSASGDPHYTSFDGHRFDFQGSCQYQLAGRCQEREELVDFQVLVQNDHRSHRAVSFTRAVEVRVYGVNITVSRDYPGRFLVDGILVHLPYILKNQLMILRSSWDVLVKTDSGLTVAFDWDSWLRLSLPAAHVTGGCGLCSNMSGSGGAATGVGGLQGSATGCGPATCNGNCTACNGARRYRARDHCGMMMAENGPFMGCHSTVDPSGYFQDCVSDLCSHQGNETLLCRALATYAAACQEARVPVGLWRNGSFCNPNCPPNSRYEPCAPACPAACCNLSLPHPCPWPCREGCRCTPGHVLSGDQCVPPAGCGCLHRGLYWPLGSSFSTAACEERCTCRAPGRVACQPRACRAHEECSIQAGVRSCYPALFGTCSALGRSSYTSFDQTAFILWGNCSHVLAETRARGHLTGFAVRLLRGAKPAGDLGVVFIAHGLAEHRSVPPQVDGMWGSLPLELSGSVHIFLHGRILRLETDFGLQVVYDGASLVTIGIPGSYQGHVAGLCGNYNGVSSDDFTLPDGSVSPNASAFASAWRADVGQDRYTEGEGRQPPCASHESQRCRLLLARDGPFSSCHSAVEPTAYFDGCLGSRTARHCGVMASYAAMCQAAGVAMVHWRDLASCSLDCPEHSRYAVCMDPCSVACLAKEAGVPCQRGCMEGCECRKGYYWDGQACVRPRNCSCYSNGTSYKVGNTHVVVQDNCQQKCTCSPARELLCQHIRPPGAAGSGPLNTLSSSPDLCQSTTCKPSEMCRVEQGQVECVPIPTSSCMVWGHLHYRTFDGYDYDFHGTCVYTIAEYCGQDAQQVPFTIHARNNHPGLPAVSFTRWVYIGVYGYNISMHKLEYGRIRVNEVSTRLPVSFGAGRGWVWQSGVSVLLETDFGLRVSYDWDWHLVITLPGTYTGRTCGLCGNFSSDAAAERLAPGGTPTPSDLEWAASWSVPHKGPYRHSCPGQCPSCSSGVLALHVYHSASYCGLLSREPFQQCHAAVGLESFFRHCVEDICVYGGARRVLCQALEAYAATCRCQGLVLDWRAPAGCALACPENSHYTLCSTPCPPTCRAGFTPPSCTAPCVESCECHPGYLLSAGSCIPAHMCGCTHGGRDYSLGESFWQEACSSRCICDPQRRSVSCRRGHCGPGQMCAIVDGEWKCQAMKHATCLVHGDSHYQTFDGATYDLHGAYTYLLVGLCATSASLQSFTVHVQNSPHGREAIASSKTLILQAYNTHISLRPALSALAPFFCQVNGTNTALPWSLDSNKLLAYRSGWSVVIQTEFGLRVSSDWNRIAWVTVPMAYAGLTCGLCGNYNRNSQDDVGEQGPEGPEALGRHWQVHGSTSCLSGRGAMGCPRCSHAARQKYGAQDCGLLVQTDGPFGECLPHVNGTSFFQACISDLCQYQGRPAAACNALAAYVAVCQAAGIPVRPWRTDHFCPQCPQHSHYELCGPGCPLTCLSLSSPQGCTSLCTEGCQCDPKFLWSGTGACVPVRACGCTYRGQFYPLGKAFYPDPLCLQRCRCHSGHAVCSPASCGNGHKCHVAAGVRGCYPAGDNLRCFLLGNATHTPLDVGPLPACNYTVAEACGQLADFSVSVEMGSSIRAMTVGLAGYSVSMEQGLRWMAKVNEELVHLPLELPDRAATLSQEGDNLLLRTDFGLRLIFHTRGAYAVLTLPAAYRSQVCGLCRDFWDSKRPLASVWGAMAPCSPRVQETIAPPPCPWEEDYAREDSCGRLSAADGPFKRCHALVSPVMHVDTCVSRLCVAGWDPALLCQSLQAYSAACQEAGAQLEPWRNDSFRPLSCPARSHYKLCTHACDLECIAAAGLARCLDRCFEGCQCERGLASDGDACVSLDACGCTTYEGRYLQEGTVCKAIDGWPKCMRFFRAAPLSPPSCAETTCKPGTVCQIVGGWPKCVPKRPSCDGSCDTIQCHPHYHTFDGHSYDFHGTCSYTVVKTCSHKPKLPAFHIIAKSQKRGNTRVSFVSQVTVKVYHYNITMVKYEHGLARVNGQRTRLPVSLHDGKLWLHQRGGQLVVEAEFGLKVYYDWNYYLVVKVTKAFLGRLCGLCGNYNGDPSDDFLTPSGHLATSAVEFGKSWKVEDGDRQCRHGCKGTCGGCRPELVRHYRGEAYCGLITKTAHNGPFRRCHALINPKAFLDDCVADLCAYDGYKQILCRALKTYADACQREGAVVKDWRRQAGCPLPCPENSQYQLCGSACPPTCNDFASLAKCRLPCTETCQCKKGYMLDGGQCIPKGRCGCIHKGRLYAPGEYFWGDKMCRQKCQCNLHSRKVTCQLSRCQEGEECRVAHGIQSCYPTRYGTCSALGESHYITFDGLHYDFRGTCIYLLAGLCHKNSSLVKFQVLVQYQRKGSKRSSGTKIVEIQVSFNPAVFSLSLISHCCPPQLNGLQINLPYNIDYDKISAYHRGWDIVVKTAFGLTVTFDGQNHIRVKVPATYGGSVCGLCGNFDGQDDNDMTMSNLLPAPTPSAFGRSWKARDIPGCMEMEKEDCMDIARVEKQHRKGKKECGLLLDRDGPFKKCHNKVNPEGYFKDCIFDRCSHKDNQTVVCHILACYAAACQAAGAQVSEWRTNKFCPPCPQNSHYEMCSTSCPATCRSLYAPSRCPKKCREGCVCDEGFVLSGDQCVPLSQCGCVHRGFYYKPGETFYPNGFCKQRCSCQAGGIVECHHFSCGPNEECRVVDGIQKCHPVVPRTGTCHAAGDPHYLTFDGYPFDFQGNCTYVLAKSCVRKGYLPSFAIHVKNERLVNATVPIKPTLSPPLPQVDGISYYLPFRLENGLVRVYYHGVNVVLLTKFGLHLSFDLNYYLAITVPKTYRSQTCGLCGNYNGKPHDDLLRPNGHLARDLRDLGVSWRVRVPGAVCDHGCASLVCPACQESRKASYVHNNYCGIIRAPYGPFSNCYSTLNPTVFFNNCVHDLCKAGGNRRLMCRSIRSYVTACQAAGVKIKPWRTRKFCPMTCPANSHYRLCANPCSSGCKGVANITKCPKICAEGCQCNKGYFWAGNECVSIRHCHCFRRGRYYKVSERVLTARCRQRCRCIPRGGVVCQSFQCPAGELCELSQGRWGCVRRDGNCTITRGDVFTTYDGVSGKVPLDGTYEISSLIDTRAASWFRVVVVFQTCKKCRAPRVTAITVYFHKLTIVVNRNGRVLVRGKGGEVPLGACRSVCLLPLQCLSIHLPIHITYIVHPSIRQ
uniref:VWFD domain-containing protein n=1 Tax=Chelydra serpentina TaxID=8475 RepID=A0A8C3SKN7_CHESE